MKRHINSFVPNTHKSGASAAPKRKHVFGRRPMRRGAQAGTRARASGAPE